MHKLLKILYTFLYVRARKVFSNCIKFRQYQVQIMVKKIKHLPQQK
jgi:hypothetical protein